MSVINNDPIYIKNQNRTKHYYQYKKNEQARGGTSCDPPKRTKVKYFYHSEAEVKKCLLMIYLTTELMNTLITHV
jgi:hypothetical protein